MSCGVGRRGVALIEVLAAIAILAIAGAGLVSFARTAGDDISRRGSREREAVEASSVLTAISLQPPEELMRRVGSLWRWHGLDVRIETVDRRRFDVQVSDTLSALVLTTRLYLPPNAR